MTILRLGGCVALLAVLLAPDGRAQIAASGGYKLGDFVIDDVGGSAASLGFSAHVSVASVTSGTTRSANFMAGLGILQSTKPAPALAPVFFAATPDFGPGAQATPVTISGLNFDKLGSAPTVTVDVGGTLATDVHVLSNTMLTATLPASEFVGPQPVTVSSTLGSSSQHEFTYTPAIRTTPVTQQKGQVVLRDYGTPGHAFLVFYAIGSAGVQPGAMQQLLPLLSYPAADGVHTIALEVPDAPVLDGMTIYFQSLDISQLNPLKGQLTNLSSTTIQ